MPGDVTPLWGLLDREDPPATRRVRGLQLGSAVIFFNELAVPGMGGMYFAKPLLWAMLGLWLAEQNKTSRFSAIRLANAVEALACWQVISNSNIPNSSLVRGRQALQNKKGTFKDLGTARGYVTNPLRRTVIQPLRALGLADGKSNVRFNQLRLTEEGEQLLELFDHGSRLRSCLLQWVSQPSTDFTAMECNKKMKCSKKLSPFFLPHNIENQLIARICRNPVREIMWDWMKKVHNTPTKASSLPSSRQNELQAGILFFTVRQKAIDLLDAAENLLRGGSSRRLSYTEAAKRLASEVECLKEPARLMKKDQAWTTVRSASQREEACGVTAAFLNDCLEEDPSAVLRKLVCRDGRILLDSGDAVLPGTAFLENQQAEQQEDDEDPLSSPKWPAHISVRVTNLYRLYLNLGGAKNGD